MASIETPGGHIDYDECGDGPTIVLVPGSCSTGAAWHLVVSTASIEPLRALGPNRSADARAPVQAHDAAVLR